MYEKDGERYYVVDSHLHFWDASPENWVPGQEEYAKGWIECFHAYQGLGPAETHWPIEKFQKYGKDAFDVKDVDYAATTYPALNFIVEHVGLPRIEDFCFMATQEPNVYAGLSVVIGGLMHARPRFFAKVMGELLFWVGEDKMLFGSDYGIWEPKWQIEGFVDWDYPGEPDYADYPRLTTEGKKKILGLNAARLYGIDVPAEALPVADGARLVEE